MTKVRGPATLGALIAHLKVRPNEWLDAGLLARELGLRPSRLVRLADSAARRGLKVEREPHKGLRLVGPPWPLVREEIEHDLGARVIGRAVTVLDETSSTNDHGAALARRGAPEGAVVVADRQTQGRGRMGRRWEALAGESLLFSVILRPRIARGKGAAQVAPLTITGAVAVAEAVRETFRRQARIRWPNDVVWRGRKLAGVLVEADPRASDGYYVLGIGINTGRVPRSVEKATSLAEMVGAPVDRARVLRSVLVHLDRLYHESARRGRAGIERRWREMSWTLGKRITLTSHGGRVRGRVVDISIARGITLETASGARRTFPAEHATLAE